MRRLLGCVELELEESRSADERSNLNSGGREATSTRYIMDGVDDDAKDCNWESCFNSEQMQLFCLLGRQ